MRLSWFLLRSALPSSPHQQIIAAQSQSPSASGSVSASAITTFIPFLSISILFATLVGSSSSLILEVSAVTPGVGVSFSEKSIMGKDDSFKIHLPTKDKDDLGGSTPQEYAFDPNSRSNLLEHEPENSWTPIQLTQFRSCGFRELWPWPWPTSPSPRRKRQKRSTNNELAILTNFDSNGNPRKVYKWNKKYITYRVSQYSKQDISPEKIDKDLATAFKLWEEHVNLRFVKSTRKDSDVDIDIRFVMGEHGDYNPFTGDMGDTLGHAFPPTVGLGGDVHFNDNFTWSEGTTFLHTATHEIGHALGLHHNFKDRTAIMSPYQGDSSCPVVLDPEDIRQLQALYGPKDPPLPWSQYVRKAAAAQDRSGISTTAEPTLEISTTAETPVRFWPWQSTNRNKSRSTEALAPFPTLSFPRTTNLPIPKNETIATTTTATATTTTPISTTTIITASDIPNPNPTTTKTPPSLVETAIEATVTVTERPAIIINPATELWTRILQTTVLIPDVSEETTSLKSDLESKSKKIPLKPPTTTVLVTPAPPLAADEDKIYFCDSNELCSKKELEENLTEDILALGSGNFELSDDSEPDSESSPNPKTDNAVTSTATATTPVVDLFLPDERTSAATPKPGDNLTVKSGGESSINGASGNQQHWLTMLDIIIRSAWILIVMILLSPSDYLSHLLTFEL